MTIKSAIALSGIVTIVYALVGVLFLEYYQEIDFIPSVILDFFVAPIVIIGFGAKSTAQAIGLFVAAFVAIWVVLFLLLLIIRLFKNLTSR